MPQFITRVALKNYKSIAACEIRLESLTVLVGPNGSGKSNFLDALKLIADALNNPLDHALRARGGLADVRRRSTGHPHDFSIEVDFVVPGVIAGRYGFKVGARGRGSFEVKRERLDAHAIPTGEPARFDVFSGEVRESTLEHPPRASADRLYLVNLSGIEPMRTVFDSLSTMGFYNLDPAQIRSIQTPDPGLVLARDGRNIAGVLGRMQEQQPQEMELIRAYLAKIVPGVRDVQRVQVANREALSFRQDVKGSRHPWSFYGNSMSDGTLRALGVLVALFQGLNAPVEPVRLVGLEEPETALHPAAASTLLEALREAGQSTQVVMTTHSPELLDDEDLRDEQIVAVRAEGGVSHLGPVDASSRRAIRDRLFTPGELLAKDRLEPDDSARIDPEQLTMFKNA